MDLLTNPYVIIFIVLAVVISNISLLKYTAHAKFDFKKKPPEPKPADEETEQASAEDAAATPAEQDTKQTPDKKE